MAALKKVELTDTPGGPLKFDDRGSAILNYYVRKVTKTNGKLQNTVISTFPMVSQFWKFNPAEYLKEPPYTKDYPPAGEYASQAK
jgi:branched-chain amino acid transport system substrate-binding protein